jgi:DNA-binding transcriptional regulator of glucitol operon
MDFLKTFVTIASIQTTYQFLQVGIQMSHFQTWKTPVKGESIIGS